MSVRLPLPNFGVTVEIAEPSSPNSRAKKILIRIFYQQGRSQDFYGGGGGGSFCKNMDSYR